MDVGIEGAQGRADVDRSVMEEAVVLDVEDRLHDVLRDPRQSHRLPVLLGVERGEDAAVAGIDDRPLGQGLELRDPVV